MTVSSCVSTRRTRGPHRRRVRCRPPRRPRRPRRQIRAAGEQLVARGRRALEGVEPRRASSATWPASLSVRAQERLR